MHRVTAITTPLIALAFGGASSFVATDVAVGQMPVASPGYHARDHARSADAENHSGIRIRMSRRQMPAEQNIPAKDANVQANNGLPVANVRAKYGHFRR